MKFCEGAQQVTLENYLNALEKAIESDKIERQHLSGKLISFNSSFKNCFRSRRKDFNESLKNQSRRKFLTFTFLLQAQV